MKSIGSESFKSLGGSIAEWVARTGKSPTAIKAYRSGAYRPPPETRAVIASRGGPAPEEWDRPATTVDRPTPRAAPVEVKASKESTVRLADRLTAQAQANAEAIEGVEDVATRTRLLEQHARTVAVLGRLTGVGLTVSARQILASPDWRLIEDRIIEGLEPWPDAMRAVADAIAPLEGGAP